MKIKKFHTSVFGLVFLILISCAGKPAQTLQSVPPVNPDASLAFFSENNLSDEMRLEYAAALQNAGLYNFTADTLSEEQIENSVEIRLNYKEEKIKPSKIPVLILEAEFLKAGKTWFRFAIKEESDKSAKKSEKKFRQKVLLERFLEETNRIKSKEPLGNNEA